MASKDSPIQEIAQELSASDVAEHFQLYAIELGAFVYGWNQLHDNLANLFWAVVGGNDGSVPLAIWHSLTSDRTQRQILSAAASAKYRRKFGKPEDKQKNKKVADRIEWLLAETDTLSIRRNMVIHAPYWFLKGAKKLVPNAFQGSPLARGLQNRDLLQEFQWCRETATVLSDFCSRLAVSLRIESEQPPWPDIPKLPNRGQKKIPQLHRRDNPPGGQ